MVRVLIVSGGADMGRKVEIGSMREVVEVIDEPRDGVRIGRIRHANGENVAIDEATLQRLIERARAGRHASPRSVRAVFVA